MALSGAFAWLAGATILQTRARRQPVDLRLGFCVLLLTIAAFHIHAAIMIASRPESTKSVFIPLIDAAVIVGLFYWTKSRIQPGGRFRLAIASIFIGALVIWPWYVKLLGGIFP